MEEVKVAAWDDDEDLNFIIWPPAPPVPACFQEAVAPSFSSSSSSLSSSPPPSLWSDEEEDEEGEDQENEEAESQEDEEEPTVGGLLLDIWAELFRHHQQILDPVLPWLRRELRAIFHSHWWQAMAVEAYILNALCDIGPDSEWLMELMQPVLENRTETFIQELVDTIVHQCSEEAHRLLGLQGTLVSGGQEEGFAARGQEDSPVAAPGPTASPELNLTSGPRLPACPNIEEQTRTAVADILVGPSHAPAAHMAREVEELNEEVEQEAAAGPSAQGSSPSSPGHLPERVQRPPKRRANSDQDPQPPCKRPPPRPQ